MAKSVVQKSVIFAARQCKLDAVGAEMFQGLSNLAVAALLCVGIIVLSCIVIEGLDYLTAAYTLRGH